MTDLRTVCTSTIEAYIAQIAEMSVTLEEKSEMTTKLANALAKIDPNTKNGDEGRAFIKKMYKMRGKMPTIKYTKATMPETPELCVDIVAGKVIQIENLQEDLDEHESFNTFFADVYCVVYKNALVTLRDGLSQIFPGGLDVSIEDAI